jgi:Spy/CpxP family protein refolding chaperone
MRTARIVLAMAVAMLIAAPLLSQERGQRDEGRRGRGNPARRALLMMERLQTAIGELNLTDEQKEKLAKVREELGPEMKETWGKADEILTEEQRKAAEEVMKKNKEAGTKGREAVTALEAAIKLTDEQKPKMDKVGEELLTLQREAMKKITEILTPEQREKFVEKMRPPRRPQQQPQPAEKKEEAK